MYWTAYGIRTQVTPLDPGAGNRPVGALAMAAAAVSTISTSQSTSISENHHQVERAYQMHRTGDFVHLPNEFSAANWARSTQAFCNIIEDDLTDNDWKEIFGSLHQLSKSQVRAARVRFSLPAEETVREALLPVDPPTPPALD